MKIPLYKPWWGKAEELIVIKALQHSIGTGDGPNTQTATKLLQNITKSKYTLLTTSCTHGLELAIRAMGVKPGDEVILPSFTMSSTANCIVLSGATPIFADIESKYFNIDPSDIERKITVKTKGIIVVHYAGMPVDMVKVQQIARKHNLFIIEDAAHAIGVKYMGKMLGTWGDIGVYSFHGTKNVSCGEGGAVMTNRLDLFEKMQIFRANGTNRNAFIEGIVDKYSWVGVGTSFFLSDILAAILIPQFKKITQINLKRQKIAQKYLSGLADLDKQIILPNAPNKSVVNWHIFAIRLKNPEFRSEFISLMRKAGIEVSYHYVPLHSAPYGMKLTSGKINHLPNTDLIFQSLVRLPIYPGLKDREVTYIIRTVHQVLAQLY